MSKNFSGNAASQGTVQGTARILGSEKDFAKFKHGDILVAKQTSPAWTPLFAAAAGIVTEFGGVLCHAAIVAREFSIPAVTGVKNATKIIKDGQKIEVNGSIGKISILES